MVSYVFITLLIYTTCPSWEYENGWTESGQEWKHSVGFCVDNTPHT